MTEDQEYQDISPTMLTWINTSNLNGNEFSVIREQRPTANITGEFDTIETPVSASVSHSQYPYPSGYGWTHIIAASTIVTSIMLVIVLGNALVVVAVAVDRSLKGPQNWFIASLAVSDLLVGLFIMPLSLSNELLGYWPFGAVLCQLWLATDVLLCTASILNLCLISLDRYWSIVRAVAYLRQRTPRRAATMIGAVWTLSAVICFPPLAGWSRPQPVLDGREQCVLSEEPGYVVYSIIGSFYLPLAVMVAVYIKIYRAARWRARRHLTSENKMSSVMSASVSKSVKSKASPRSNEKATDAGRCVTKHLSLKSSVTDYLSPGRHRGRPKWSCSSTNLDAEQFNDKSKPPDQSRKTQERRQRSEPDFASASNNVAAAAASSEADDELLTVVVINRQNEARQNEVLSDINELVSLNEIGSRESNEACRENDDSKRSDRLVTTPTDAALVATSTSSIHQPFDANFKSTYLCQHRDEDVMTSAQNSADKIVVVIVSSVATSLTTPALTSSSMSMPVSTSSLTSVVASSSVSVADAGRRRNSSTSSFLTSSTTCSPNKFLVQLANSDSGCAGEKKLLVAKAVRDYRSTSNRCSVTSAVEDSIIAADDESAVECSSSRPRRRMRPSWTGVGARRRLSLALATTSSGRRGAKTEGIFADTERAKRKAARARERRATIVLGIVMISFIGCWLPFFSVYPVALLTDTKVPGPLFGVIFWLGYCNSALNPIIYTVFNRDFRRAFQKILKERITRCKAASWV